MYKLIRRISSSFFPRPDRPWPEDATSNAPVIGRKRRLSSEEPVSQKRHRTESVEGDADAEGQASSSARREETPSQAVTEVTEGVREVELEDTQGEKEDGVVAEAAAVPLPESPELQAQKEAVEVKEVEAAPEKGEVQEKEGVSEQEAVAEKGEETKDVVEAPKVNGVHVEEPKESEKTAPVDAEVAVPEDATSASASPSKMNKTADAPAPVEESKETSFAPAEAPTQTETQES
ncbi:hypothetical protein K474DRAFT_1676741 [Panus rudis PR-1116 ss-1]|nr:hypothetical protein K474DRAFT_1676741 [Panus rudis PR-1116 ss-1]